MNSFSLMVLWEDMRQLAYPAALRIPVTPSRRGEILQPRRRPRPAPQETAVQVQDLCPLPLPAS